MATPPRPRRPFMEPLRKRGIYILPNLFTSLALFAGFFAIVQGMNHEFEKAAIAIFVAMVLDGIDGRVARMTNTQSAFGAEYDSLSDMVSFGAAPALVMYEWALRDMGRLGWIAAFVYCVCTALRLARFNTQLAVADKRYFTGLPSPAAAALVAGMIWVFNDYQVGGGEVKWIAWGVTLFAGVTMVSNVKYYSGKDFNLRRIVPFWVTIAIVMGLLVVASDPSHALWGLFVAYSISGYVMWLVNRWRAEASEKQFADIREAIEDGDLSGLARILSRGSSANTLVSGGRSILMFAIEETNLPAVEFLIAQGAEPNHQDEQGVSPLIAAARIGFTEAVQLLLEGGADPNLRDLSGVTALDFAEQYGAADITAALLRFGAKSGKELGPKQP
jgi:CDP-diacylglycerol--serine O-phosphatidyltransferase